MFYRKYLAFYDSTCPWVWVVLFSWWVDRLFMEMGHRNENVEFCAHNDLQYVYIHRYITAVAVLTQTTTAAIRRKLQFEREATLTGAGKTCLLHIYWTQFCLTVGWTSVLAVLFDVSPWLCLPNVLTKRASIALVALVNIIAALFLESYGWDWSIRRGLIESL